MNIISRATKYVFDSSTLIHEVDNNNVFFKTIVGKYRLSGKDITIAFRRLINCFQIAALPQDVIEELGGIYEKNALSDLIAYLVIKKVILPESDYRELNHFEPDFLEKYRYFATGGKRLQEIVNEMRTMRLGLVCTYQFAKCFLRNLEEDKIFGHINCLLIDKVNIPRENFTTYTKISCLGEQAELLISKLINESDFIVVNCNYESFSLFNYVNERCLESNKKWMRVVTMDECAEIGPVFIPRETCCYSCLDKRATDSLQGKSSVVYALLQKQQKKYYDKELSTHSSYHLISIASDISFFEIMRFFSELDCHIKGSVLTFFAEDYKTRFSRVFKDSQCNCSRAQE